MKISKIGKKTTWIKILERSKRSLFNLQYIFFLFQGNPKDLDLRSKASYRILIQKSKRWERSKYRDFYGINFFFQNDLIILIFLEFSSYLTWLSSIICGGVQVYLLSLPVFGRWFRFLQLQLPFEVVLFHFNYLLRLCSAVSVSDSNKHSPTLRSAIWSSRCHGIPSWLYSVTWTDVIMGHLLEFVLLLETRCTIERNLQLWSGVRTTWYCCLADLGPCDTMKVGRGCSVWTVELFSVIRCKIALFCCMFVNVI